MSRYVVPNINLETHEVVEVFHVTKFFDKDGNPTGDPSQAMTCVAHDGTCYHSLDLEYFNLYSVH